MPEIVKPTPRQFRATQEHVQHPKDIPRLEWRAHAFSRPTARVRGEDEAGIAPIAAGLQAFLELPLAVFPRVPSSRAIH